MEVGVAFFIVAALIIVVWVVVEFKRVRHKIFAVVLIGLIIFLYVSSSMVFKDKEIDFKSLPGISMAFKTYFAWLGSAFLNMKTITVNAVKMNWEPANETNSTTIVENVIG